MPTPPAPQPDLRQVFYISRCLAQPVAVEYILAGARRQNSQRQVTGALLFTGGHFAQLLEGSAQAIDETLDIIRRDARHEAMRTLVDEPAPQRRFADWTMAYVQSPGADDLIAQLLATPTVPAERAARLLGLMFQAG